MYFKKTICPHCQSSYDEMNDYCPNCHSRNELHLDYKVKHPLFYVDLAREIMLLILGLVGLTIFVLLFTLIFSNIYQSDKQTGLMYIESSSYALFFVFVIAIIFPYLKNLLDYLKKWDAYIFGLAGSIILIGGSIAISTLMNILVPSAGTGGNQSGIIEMTKAFPALAIIIFGIIGPICEEFAYRVGLFTLLRRVHPALAYVVSSLIFAFIHFDFAGDMITELASLPSYIYGALVFSVIYDYKGVVASTTTHIINNLYSLIAILVF